MKHLHLHLPRPFRPEREIILIRNIFMRDLFAALNFKNLFSTLSFLSSLTLWKENTFSTFVNYVKKEKSYRAIHSEKAQEGQN